MERVFLVGYMGVGKTTIGRCLASLLGWSFIDLDHYIEHRYRKSLSLIFKEKGEMGFRELEHNLLQEVCMIEKVVVSTGGGAPCFMGNIDIMLSSGGVVYLKAEMDLLFSRLLRGREHRPLIASMDNVELMDFISKSLDLRLPYYLRANYILSIESDRFDIQPSCKELAEWVISNGK
ncbi:MAG: shikimate kinase [Bacteroidales bacterium]